VGVRKNPTPKGGDTYLSIKGSPREEVVKKMAKMYRLHYYDAYYYCQVFDTMFDTLMRLGGEVTIDGVIEVKVKRKSKQTEANRKYLNQVMRGEAKLYYSKHIHQKEIL